MRAGSLITDQARASIGAEKPPRAGLVTARDIRKYCVAVDDLNPIYLDDEAARAAGYLGIVAPPLFLSSVTRPIPPASELLPDGQFRMVAAPTLMGQTIMGGFDLEIAGVARPGDEVLERSRVVSLYERTGRSGPLAFQESESTYHTHGGELLQTSRGTLIIRPVGAPAGHDETSAHPTTPVVGPSRAEGGDPLHAAIGAELPALVKQPTEVAVFMYGAVIWGVHRIHYDRDYARSEGLKDIVVHGQLQASYLQQLVTDWLGAAGRLQRLACRFRSLAYVNDTLVCTGRVVNRTGEDGAMPYETLLVERHGEVGVITLNRPKKLNAINVAMANDLRDGVAELNADPDIGAIVLTGAGRAFSAGGDSGRIDDWARSEREQPAQQPSLPNILWLEQVRASKPLVCAINGLCMGAALARTLACDVRLASTRATFSIHFAKLGLSPEIACTQILPQIVGLQVAADLLMSARTIGAAEALRIGLVLKVVEPEELLPEARRLASEYAENPPQAVLQVKQLLYRNYLEKETTLVVRREGDAQRRLAGTPETREALAALREKRRPDFRRLRANL